LSTKTKTTTTTRDDDGEGRAASIGRRRSLLAAQRFSYSTTPPAMRVYVQESLTLALYNDNQIVDGVATTGTAEKARWQLRCR
jgi:hypothetical protein